MSSINVWARGSNWCIRNFFGHEFGTLNSRTMRILSLGSAVVGSPLSMGNSLRNLFISFTQAMNSWVLTLAGLQRMKFLFVSFSCTIAAMLQAANALPASKQWVILYWPGPFMMFWPCRTWPRLHFHHSQSLEGIPALKYGTLKSWVAKFSSSRTVGKLESDVGSMWVVFVLWSFIRNWGSCLFKRVSRVWKPNLHLVLDGCFQWDC